MAPTSFATMCEACVPLAGTCTANCPPGASASVQRRSTSSWAGTHCRLALASTRSSRGAIRSSSSTWRGRRARTRRPSPSGVRLRPSLEHRRRRIDADERRRTEPGRRPPRSTLRRHIRDRPSGRPWSGRRVRPGPRRVAPVRSRIVGTGRDPNRSWERAVLVSNLYCPAVRLRPGPARTQAAASEAGGSARTSPALSTHWRARAPVRLRHTKYIAAPIMIGIT